MLIWQFFTGVLPCALALMEMSVNLTDNLLAENIYLFTNLLKYALKDFLIKNVLK